MTSGDGHADLAHKTGDIVVPLAVRLDEFGSGVPAKGLSDSRGLSDDAFAARYGDWYFVVHVDDIARGVESDEPPLADLAGSIGSEGLYVFPLVSSGTSTERYVTVGRSRANDVCIPHGSVSRNHCVFRLEGDTVTLHDECSSYGTFVGGNRVGERNNEPIEAQDGAALRIGHIPGMIVSVATLRQLL